MLTGLKRLLIVFLRWQCVDSSTLGELDDLLKLIENPALAEAYFRKIASAGQKADTCVGDL